MYIGLVALLPLAILVGLANERLFMGQALAEFVSELARMPAADPEALMAAALRDPFAEGRLPEAGTRHVRRLGRALRSTSSRTTRRSRGSSATTSRWRR